MSRRLPVLLGLALALLASLGALAADPEPAGPLSEGQVIRQARELINDGQLEQAAELLTQAVKAHPMAPELRMNLGYVHELLGRVDDAVEQYAAIVALAPGNSYAAGRLERICYGETFPTRLMTDQISLLPVRFVRFVIRRPDAQSMTAASTVSVLYPGEMRAAGRPLTKTVPPGVLTGQPCEFNRVIYSFAGETARGRMWQCGRVYYPSNLLSREGRDYGPLAASLARILARFEAYLSELAPRPEEPAPLSVWLCESGPAGGETAGSDIYLYQVNTLRPAEEWQRELAHEMAHARLPELGGYRDPEPSLEGLFGQAWLLAALAREAEQATGEAWRSPAAQQWIDGLWPVGTADLTGLIENEVVGAVRLWQTEGPYSADVTSARAGRMACGLLLWVQAAHGTQALRRVLGAELGTLPALAARYASWLQESEGRVDLAAAAGWSGYGPDPAWLPFGPRPAEATQATPWRARCFLPDGTWHLLGDGKTPLTARWSPAQAEEDQALVWAPQVLSRGEWGLLEVAGSGEEPVRFEKLSLRPASQT